jgi:biopolymer transport protein ExbB
MVQNRLRGKGKTPDGISDRAVVAGIALWRQFGPGDELRRQLSGAYMDLESGIKRYGRLVSSLVGIAPLLGLLGTVVGMIETFDSLADMSLFSQSGGIAAGIATALFTTQMGLVVAVPGVMVKALLDRRQQQIAHDLMQIKDILCSLPLPDHAGPQTAPALVEV